MRAATLLALLLTGCFDLSRLDARRLDATTPFDAATPRDASAAVDSAMADGIDAEMSVCPAAGSSEFNLIMKDNTETPAAFGGMGPPPDWGEVGDFVSSGTVNSACIATTSTFVCAGTSAGTDYINGPPSSTSVVGDSYRMRIWLRGGAPVDAGGLSILAAGKVYLQDQSGHMLGSSVSYSNGDATWLEVDTAPVALPMGTTSVYPFFTLNPSTCVVINYVSVEDTSSP